MTRNLKIWIYFGMYFQLAKVNVSSNEGDCKAVNGLCRSHHIPTWGPAPPPELLKTGLEFLPDNFLIEEIDKEVYTGENAFSNEGLLQVPLRERVGMLLRTLKGLQREKPEGTSYIGSGSDLERKPAWSFYPYRLKKLAKVELDIYQILKRYHLEGHGRKKPFLALKGYLRDIEESSLLAVSKDDPFMYIGSHPLLIFRMIRRFAEDLQPVLRKIEEALGQERGTGWGEVGRRIVSFARSYSLTKKLAAYLPGSLSVADPIAEVYAANPEMEVFPNKEDLQDCLVALVRIQNGTGLRTEEFARGVLQELDTGLGLNVWHAMEVGTFLLEEEKWDLGVQWVYLGWKSVAVADRPKKLAFVEEFFRKVLDYAIGQHDNQFPKRKGYRANPGTFTRVVGNTSTNPLLLERRVQLIEREAQEPSVRRNSTWNWAIPMNFVQVCSGKNLQTMEERSRLKCYLIRDKHPYWLINPLKMELLHEHPPVLQVWDFIGPACMERMKAEAVGGLARSKVFNKEDTNPKASSKVSKDRTSSQVWLGDGHEQGKFLKPLTKRLELLTGLRIAPEGASEQYQVAAYGPSHHYNTHVDAFPDPKKCEEKGNRIVTAMGYLSDVEVGGRTGFPVLGIAAEPKKGSVVLWENLVDDMTKADFRTYHGGCPVVFGVKWITNKWILASENMFRYPCPAN